jgi:hypothetical protein
MTTKIQLYLVALCLSDIIKSKVMSVTVGRLGRCGNATIPQKPFLLYDESSFVHKIFNMIDCRNSFWSLVCKKRQI